MRRLLLALWIVIGGTTLFAQSLQLESTVIPELEVCGTAVGYTVRLENIGGTTAQSPVVTIALPSGIEYVSGSISETSNYNVQEQSVGNSAALTFSADDLPIGDSIVFSIDYVATGAAVNFQSQGGVFRNDLSCTYTGGSDNHQSQSYNILYPALSILSVSPTSQTIVSGGSTTRSINIINGGNGKIDRIVLTDVRNAASLTLSGTDLGTINGDSIVLSGADFTGIGNGDQFLDQFESVTITEILSGTSCSDVTVTSSLNAHWGCAGTQFTTSTSYGHVTIDFDNPNLKLAATETLESCFGGGEASVQSLRLVNTGSGLASGIEVDIFKSSGTTYDETIYSRFDPASVKYQLGASGTPTAITPSQTTATQSTGNYSCLGNSPIGRMLIAPPNLNPGDTLYLTWDMYSCCPTSCSNDKVKGWDAEVDYTDACGTTPYNKTVSGQDVNSQLMTFTTESPVDLEDGENEDFHFIVSSFENELPIGTHSVYTAIFQLEEGLTYQSLRWHSNTVDWVPASIDYNSNTHTVTAKYPATEPFTVPKSEFELILQGNCGAAGWKTIELDMYFNPDTTCTTGCNIPLGCDVTTTSYLHCPILNCTSLKVLDFAVARRNFGSPDNDLDGLPDGSGTLDLNKIKVERAMVGDTLGTTIRAMIEPTVGSTWSFAGFESDIDYGSVLRFLDAELTLYDASAGTHYVLSGLTATNSTNGNQGLFNVDLSSTVLATANPALSGFQYGAGDSLSLFVTYRVDASVSGLLKEITFLNDFYLSSVSNPTGNQRESCNNRNGRATLIGYDFRNDSKNNATVNACTKIINQNFGMSIGDLSSNYAGGNLFPFEYRHWGILKEARVVIPPNYSHVNTIINFYSTKSTNNSQTTTLNSLSPDAINGDTLYYDISQYFDSGQLRLSDDGWDGRLRVELAPNCDVPVNTYQDVEWTFNYEKSSAIDGQTSGYIAAANPDRVRYQPSTFLLNSNDPIQDALTRKVNWDFKVQNTSSSGADHAWLHLDAPSHIVIDSVTFDGGSTLTLQNDIYLIGTINSGSTADLTIHGTLTGCDTVNMTAYSGFECTGYPNDFASFNCTYEQMDLYVEPKEAAFQQRISSQLMQDPCTPQLELTLDISSVKMGHVFDMTIDLITTDTSKIKIVSGTSEFQYNTSNSYASISDPAYGAGIYSYTVSNLNSTFPANGIPGVLDLSNNQYRLKMIVELGSQFVVGDFLEINIAGANACGEALPTVELAFDPNSKFTKDATSGLHLDIGNTWSGSWGDYDNDGYDDLFVPNNSLSDPNLLYHNNGDGTFSKANINPLTTDLGASISGSWGDYDNDGFLDLFVTNNVNSSNRLYHNEGNGSFTAVTNSPIVDLGIYSHSAAWADYNLDGNLDLVVSDFQPTHFNYLFLGDGQGGFSEDQNSEISLSATSAIGVAWGDYDNDGDPDLFIANANGQNNQLFRNDQGVFAEVTTGDVVNDGGTSAGGIWGDYDNDGDLDLFVTNTGAIDPNFFYENNGDGTFTKITAGTIVNHVGASHGASWIDFDNDGDLDLFVANDQNQSNFFFSNNGDKSFTMLTNAITEEANDSYGTAWSDYDNDGDYDLFVANRGSNSNDFFINEKGSCTNHIVVKLIGCNSNRYGVGAFVRVKANMGGGDLWQTKHVSTQTSAMGGQNSSKLLFGLLDATSVDSVVVQWPSGMVTVVTNPTPNQLLTIAEPCGAKVCGVVYHDENENGVQDNGEVGIPNMKLIVNPGNFQVLTDAQGAYEVYLADGNYTLEQSLDARWTQLTPAGNSNYPLSINLSNQSEYCGQDFGNRANCTDPDLEINVGTSAFRRGLTNDLHFSLHNSGAFDATGTFNITLEMTDNLYLVGGGWISESTTGGMRTYVFQMGNLDALSYFYAELQDSVDAAANIDDVVTLRAHITYSGDECDTTNNEFFVSDKVVGSIDPNDKQVFVQGKGVQSIVLPNERLLYKIRFQNLGNYAARIVTIKDTLSPHLDWESFQVESSSHPFSVWLTDNVLTFWNDGIELPDSASDPEGSQGYITFSISPKEGLVPFTVVENEAHIQFDYNGYITTNNTKIVVANERRDTEGPQPLVYPSPAQKDCWALLLDENKQPLPLRELEIADFQGNVILRIPVSGDRVHLETAELVDGIYLLGLTSETGKTYHTRFSIIK